MAAELLRHLQDQPICSEMNWERYLIMLLATLRGFSEQIQYEVKFPAKIKWLRRKTLLLAAATALLFIRQQGASLKAAHRGVAPK